MLNLLAKTSPEKKMEKRDFRANYNRGGKRGKRKRKLEGNNNNNM